VPIVSAAFAGFVVAALAAYHLLPERSKRGWLLAVSYAFYALCAWRFLPLLLAVTVVTFALAAKVGPGRPHRRRWLAAGVAMALGVLLALRPTFRDDPFASPFVVVGLSFYALQALSYLLDVSSGALRTRGTRSRSTSRTSRSSWPAPSSARAPSCRGSPSRGPSTIRPSPGRSV
jgi:hypothetical protein